MGICTRAALLFIISNPFNSLFVSLTYLPANHIDGLVQSCSKAVANALELLQSCTEPPICGWPNSFRVILTSRVFVASFIAWQWYGLRLSQCSMCMSKTEGPQTGRVTKTKRPPERSQSGVATNRNGHKPERSQTGKATNRNRHNRLIQRAIELCFR